MKAVVYERYGPPDVLRIAEIDKPVPGDGEVLVAVRAAGLNPMDRHTMRGTPYLFRLALGLSKPKNPRLGSDLAGQVEAVGRNVTRFKPGDEVFGAGKGALGEFVCTAEAALALKPRNVTFEQAGAVAVAGLTALQGLRNTGKVQPGQKVLINGAAGGVGTFAVQIAKSFGAEVTGVCSTRNLELVRSIGADRAIDYTQEDFTRSGERYDLILDCIGNHPLAACRRVLTPKGTYAMVGADGGSWIGPLGRVLRMLLPSPFAGPKLALVQAKRSQEDLALLGDLMAAGKVTPVLDRTYPLSEVAAAIGYLEKGHARGKVVVTV